MSESKPKRKPKPPHDISATIYLQAKEQGLHGGLGAMPPQYAEAFRRSQREAASSVEPELEPEPEAGRDRKSEPTRRYTGASTPRGYSGALLRSQSKAVPPKPEVRLPEPEPGTEEGLRPLTRMVEHFKALAVWVESCWRAIVRLVSHYPVISAFMVVALLLVGILAIDMTAGLVAVAVGGTAAGIAALVKRQ